MQYIDAIGYKYAKYWAFSITIITIFFLIIKYVIGHSDMAEMPSLEDIKKIRELTPAYPPPLTNFMDSSNPFTTK
jgi:hypothetical protein